MGNYKGLERVNMVTVREGEEGSSIDPQRYVRYFTDDKGELLGTNDPHRSTSVRETETNGTGAGGFNPDKE